VLMDIGCHVANEMIAVTNSCRVLKSAHKSLDMHVDLKRTPGT
jgi:hypothetical protein